MKEKTKIEPHLLARYHLNECNYQEMSKVELWKDSELENKKEFMMAKEILKKEKESTFKPNTEKALKRVLDKLPEQKQINRSVLNNTWLRVAAILIIVLGIAGIVWQNSSLSETEYKVYTELNDKGQIVLSDGSVVWLRQGSTLKYPDTFKGKKRQIVFDGEGYFEISADKKHPFVVEAAGTITRVLGTKFSLNTFLADSTIRVILDEGKITFTAKMNNNHESIELEPGHSATFYSQNHSIELIENDDHNHAAWKTNTLIFLDAPLSRIISDIEEFYSINIGEIPSDIADQLFSITYDSLTTSDEALESLSMLIDIDIVKEGEFYYLQPNS